MPSSERSKPRVTTPRLTKSGPTMTARRQAPAQLSSRTGGLRWPLAFLGPLGLTSNLLSAGFTPPLGSEFTGRASWGTAA